MNASICWIFLLSLWFSPLSLAKPLKPEQVPETLKPWIDWVLTDKPEPICPFIYNDFTLKHCVWPTYLTLDLQTKKGSFKQSGQVYKESWIGLPGDNQHWPLKVSANNKAVVVLEKNGIPFVKLAAGPYQISGEFLWDKLPDNLPIPADSGLIALQINGQQIEKPSLKNSQLWLKQSETGQNTAADSQNNLDIQVFRKIIDDVPLQILTQIELDVSGQQREIRLPKPLLADFIPISLVSPLPTRMEADGQLLVQLRPGHWQISLLARHLAEINTLKLEENSPDWPSSEIWVLASQPDLRMVEVEQISPIDASQTNLPDDWKQLPAYKLNQGQTLQLKVIRRGDPNPEPNQLNLTRQLWLDFSGNGYTVNDKISGMMSRDWRLNALETNQLGRVTLDGETQLITKQADTGKSGVELRTGLLNLEADSRINGATDKISVVGWEQNFHSVHAELNLPPGWRLLATSGIDNQPETWLANWTLLDLFMVLIAALATSRLWSIPWGVFALMTLALIWHEPGSPHFVWLNILAATALIKVLPENKFLRYMYVYRALCWLSLVLISLPFMVNELRVALYPQLEHPAQVIIPQNYAEIVGAGSSLHTRALNAPAMAAPEAPPAKMEMYDRLEAQKSKMLASSLLEREDSLAKFDRIDPKAHVQTGPGLPQWQWRKIYLNWNGAVDNAQQLHLWYLSPTVNLILNFIRVALLALLALLMFGMTNKQKFNFKSNAPLLMLLLLLPMLTFTSPAAWCDYPNQTLLDNLKSRLQEAPEKPDCLPSCATISHMQLDLADNQLNINLQVHTQQAVAIPLPADTEQWFPMHVQVDGEAAKGMYRDEQSLWLNLEPGLHQVTLSAVTPAMHKFTLPLPLKPKFTSINIKGWEAVGLAENGLADDQLQFSRIISSTSSATKPILESSVLPAFMKIERTLLFGLDWQVQTRISRLSPADTPVVLSVPLLKGESVTSAGVRIKADLVEVNMSAGQVFFEWQSSLEKSADLLLQAAQNPEWVEVWQADVSPIWHLTTSGIPMMHLNNNSRWLPEWHPWPGEQLTLNLGRPEGVSGQTLTIDNSVLTIKPGQRNQEANLTMSLRSSQGSQYSLVLPDGAELQSLTINGRSQPIRLEGTKLTLPINPGKQEINLMWRQVGGISMIYHSPLVDLQTLSVNSKLNIILGQDRWVLWTAGPSFGPAILFWGLLLVLSLVAVALNKIPLTPLRAWQWFLLLLGLSQIPLEAAGVVIGWLMLLGWRGQAKQIKPGYFNALQISIAALSLVALGLLFLAVEQGLLGSPEMQISGNQSTAFNLNWYQDRNPSTLPVATVISVPLLVYRLLMLAWSLWMAVSLLNWLKWGWGCFASNGLWVRMEKKPKLKPQFDTENKET